jgi:hypothetical protein
VSRDGVAAALPVPGRQAHRHVLIADLQVREAVLLNGTWFTGGKCGTGVFACEEALQQLHDAVEKVYQETKDDLPHQPAQVLPIGLRSGR